MPAPLFDRSRLRFRLLRDRPNRVSVERDRVDPDSPPPALPPEIREGVEAAAEAVAAARSAGRPVILAFGAHAIKNGLGALLARLIARGWVTHLATNGAGIIHDWELAFQGETSEDVRENVARGEFGLWEETGAWLNLALAVGAWEGRGYGESVGAMILSEGLAIPAVEELRAAMEAGAAAAPGDAASAPSSQAPSAAPGTLERAAAAADLLGVTAAAGLSPGFLRIPHPFKEHSLQAAACRLGVPFTAHPMFGHDILYTHPLNRGAAVGRTAERDFLSYAAAVSGLEGGVYLSVGSAVMSPMIFEKSLSMSRNVALREGRRIERFDLIVVDLAPLAWDWERQGEPPSDHPAYYLRYLKTFSRMGGRMRYLGVDNRAFLLNLAARLPGPGAGTPPLPGRSPS